MLVLSRKTGESIEIGDNIVITVNRVTGDKVRIGVAAPENLVIHRREIADAIRRRGEPVERRQRPQNNG